MGTLFAIVESGYAQSAEAGAAIGTGDSAIGANVSTGNAGETIETASAPRATLGQCNTTQLAYRTETGLVQTTSQNFVLMPAMHRPIVIPGSTPRCVVVEFIGEVTTSSGGLLSLQARISGVGTSLTPQVFLARDTGPYQARFARFIFPSVPPGERTVRIDWRSSGGQVMGVFTRTLTIEY
jgi:hypothetical protein